MKMIEVPSQLNIESETLLLRCSIAKLIFIAGILSLVVSSQNRAFSTEKKAGPNIIVILLDDMGFSDLGCYGGEIETPHIDALAKNGLRFSQFYNTARCWPTRAALMTGRYQHQVGMAMNMGPNAPRAYTGNIPQSARMIPELLKPRGYRCYHVGKWHLNARGPMHNQTWPLARGYDHSYYMFRQDNFFNPKMLFDDRSKIERPGSNNPDYYVTTAFTNQALKRLKEHSAQHSDQPFFLYLAHTAPHFPLHALAEDVARFRGKYRQGWDEIRKQRLARQQASGLLNCKLSPQDPVALKWDTLSESEKDKWDARMATHAAMIYRIDVGVGRIVAQLKQMDAMENTLIFVLSDNGASAEYIVRGDGNKPGAAPGSRESYRCLEVSWSNASNTPFKEHKMWTYEGGISTPLIAHWPAGIQKPNRQTEHIGHVIDLLPTILDVAGAEYPKAYQNKPTLSPTGLSFADLFINEKPKQHEFLFWEHTGNLALRSGDWKIVASENQPWELYNLKEDRSELHNLAAMKPKLMLDLVYRWQKYADKIGVVEWGTFPQSHRKHTPDYKKK